MQAPLTTDVEAALLVDEAMEGKSGGGVEILIRRCFIKAKIGSKAGGKVAVRAHEPSSGVKSWRGSQWNEKKTRQRLCNAPAKADRVGTE